MKEQLISFPVAKLAMEKGFDELCLYGYTNLESNHPKYGKIHDFGHAYAIRPYARNSSYPLNDLITASTQSFLQKWLREKHNIIVSIIPHFYGPEGKSVKYQYSIFVFTDPREFDNYEDCLEIGLQEGLSQIKL